MNQRSSIKGSDNDDAGLVSALVSLDGLDSAVPMVVDMRSLPDLVGALSPETVSRCAAAAAEQGSNRPEVLRGLLLSHGEPELETVVHIEAIAGFDPDLVRKCVLQRPATGSRPSRFLIHSTLPRLEDGSTDLEILAATSPHEYLVLDQSFLPPVAPSSVRSGGERNLVVPLQTTGTGTPIFGLHNIGENASYYRDLARNLGDGQPFYCLSAARPFHLFESTSSVPDHPIEVAEIAASYLRDIDRLAPAGPLVLAGVCQGGVVAYEAAKQLQERGRSVQLMIMISDWHAPETTYVDSASARSSERLRNIRAGGLSLVIRRVISKDILTQRLTYMRLSRLGETVALRICRILSVKPTTRLLVREYIERTNRAVRSYRYTPYSGRTVIFRAEGDLRLPPEADQGAGGWGELISDLEIIRTPGYNNPSMLSDPNAAVLARRLASILDHSR